MNDLAPGRFYIAHNFSGWIKARRKALKAKTQTELTLVFAQTDMKTNTETFQKYTI